MDDIANDPSTTAALMPGAALAGSIEQDGDVDYVRVDLVAGHPYRFDMVGRSFSDRFSLEDPVLALVASDGRVVAEDDDALAGLNARIDYVPDADGTYYLVASAYAGAGTYQVTMRLNVSAGEPGWAPDDAVALLPGQGTSGAVEFAGDIDWFTLDLVAGATYAFALAGADSDHGTLEDPFLGLYAPDGTVVAEGDDDGDLRDAVINFTPAASGRYILGAKAFGPAVGSYELSTRVIGSSVIDAYRTWGGRDPSTAEVGYWTARMAEGTTAADIRGAILADPLGISHAGAVIADLYQTWFGRAPGAGEIDVWRRLFAAGADFATLRGALLADASGQAHAAAVITSLYGEWFGRAPSAAEIDVWKGLFSAGADFGTLRSALLADPSGQAHTAATIASLYSEWFGRAPNAGEVAVWQDLFAGGADFSTLRGALLADASGQAHTTATITGLYQTWFGRAPSAGEIDVWKGLFAGGADFGTLHDTLLRASDGAAARHDVGTPNADTFIFAAGLKTLTIGGFDPAADRVAVSAAYAGTDLLDAAHAREVTALDGTTDVLVQLDAQHAILLEHTRLAALHGSDFAFVL